MYKYDVEKARAAIRALDKETLLDIVERFEAADAGVTEQVNADMQEVIQEMQIAENLQVICAAKGYAPQAMWDFIAMQLAQNSVVPDVGALS